MRDQAQGDPVPDVVADRAIVAAHEVMGFGAQGIQLEAAAQPDAGLAIGADFCLFTLTMYTCIIRK